MNNTTTSNQRRSSTLNETVSALRGSRGRYFGLDTVQGETLNARFVGETNCYMTVYDRNADQFRSFSKKSIAKVRISKKEYVVG